jgi:hypothetical protein
VPADRGQPPELLPLDVVDLGIVEHAHRRLVVSPSKLAK